MGRGHGDRLSVLDATFLRLETPTEHMHTGGLFIFEPPTDGGVDFSRFLDLVHSRLHLVPRFRQRLATPPLGLAAPIWVDDRHFDIAYHVRHAALPPPGRIDQLTDYVARIMSRQLDRSRPLWELYVVEGLEDGRVAYLGKTHHAMIDGVTGIDIATLLLDAEREAGEIPPPRPWHPADPPSEVGLAVSAVREAAGSPRAVLRSVRRARDTGPGRVVERVTQVGQGLFSMASSVGPAPSSPLNRRNGGFRRYAIQRVPLDEVKQVKDAFGVTVNDVILATVGDAVGRFLRGRGDETEGLELRVMVPVSVRSEADGTLFGNRVSSVFIRLPVEEMDPSERLQIVHEAMRDVKEHKQAVGAEFLVGLSAYAPPTLHGLAARLAARTRLYNFVVTNVPGPQMPLYSMGMRLIGAFPIMPLAQNHSFAVGVTSIDGWLNFGFVGDWDSLPDLENVTGHVIDALAELAKHASAVGVRGELVRRERPEGDDIDRPS
jgi:diacylglycerol O-acyltransferase / wax synthase